MTPGKEVSVVGFDDLNDSRLLSPPLTTVRVKGADIGREACYLLERLLGNEHAPKKILVDVELIERESNTPPTGSMGAATEPLERKARKGR
ncbi:substrate-binding domain-containing protein [Veronia nyctiphanis]|uniref:substrate-binding domain-containing protein n=1 Tax=Veronia nyctiphanis TaxID=1278244 RepID=UPI001F40BBD7|nr:substrate-binding domain-containing protein [Veronia nyctiphanis]